MVRSSATPPDPLSGPITMGELRTRLAEMTDRVLAGEEITVLRGRGPVARFVPCEPPRRRRPSVLHEMLGERVMRESLAVFDEPLSERGRRIVSEEGMGEVGIRTGLPEGRAVERDPGVGESGRERRAAGAA